MKRSDITDEQSRLDYATHRVLRHKYGKSIEWYNQKFSEQEGRCAICNAHQTEFKRNLHVDHNHETGLIRDLLCSNCNHLVGKCKENVELLSKIAEYIEKWSLIDSEQAELFK